MVSSVPYIHLRDALERAARFRRLASRGWACDFELEQVIFAVAVPPPIVVNAAGWAKAGVINDPYAPPGHLVVWWNPDTNEVKVEKPMSFREPDKPRFLGDPLYRTPPVSSRADRYPFTAVSGYTYYFGGQSYSPEEAEVETARRGSIDGWTWVQD